MDRRAKKTEQKRKDRDRAKKRAAAKAARGPSEQALLVRSGARGEFGPCFISAGWDDDGLSAPALVSVIATRKLPSGALLPEVALIDRTCLGVKNAFVKEPLVAHELRELVDDVARAHGEMFPCEPLVAQSVVFHALDYAGRLGFEPHPDFWIELFGPRPATLLDTPWANRDKPLYTSGPYDNVSVVMSRLTQAAGADGFDYIDAMALEDDDEGLLGGDVLRELVEGLGDQGEDEDEDEDDDDDPVIIHSPLERKVSRDEVALHICIYRLASEATWSLELEDHLGGSTVWDERFDTDQAALDEALSAIEEEGMSSFVVRSTDGDPSSPQRPQR